MRQIAFFLLMLSATSSGLLAQNTIQLNHIALHVVDLKTSTIFYRDVVGLDTLANPFNDGLHTWFTVGPKSHLHLIQGAIGKPDHNKNTHLCFSVPSVDAFMEVLDNNNILFESWEGDKMKPTTRVDGVKQIYFKDPDGYWIEINDASE